MSQTLPILVVEDERSLNALVADELRFHGFQVLQAFTGPEGIKQFNDGKVAMVILDVMLPGCDGFEVCRMIRAANPLVPVLMLTARDSEIDRVVGLEVGADDYVVKPFSLRELMARVKAQFRKADAFSAATFDADRAANGTIVELADCQLDSAARQVTVLGHVIPLTRKEFDLLELLLRYRGRVLTREWLLERIWGEEFDGNTRTVDTHVMRIRDKLGRDALASQRIVSVRGIGYRAESDGTP
jgi:two-component system response regulator RegX3